jgi:hypothetical protein
MSAEMLAMTETNRVGRFLWPIVSVGGKRWSKALVRHGTDARAVKSRGAGTGRDGPPTTHFTVVHK